MKIMHVKMIDQRGVKTKKGQKLSTLFDSKIFSLLQLLRHLETGCVSGYSA